MVREGFGTVRICTIDAKENVVIAGGFNGDYVCRVLHRGKPDYKKLGNITEDSNGITNHMQLIRNRTGGLAS
jgi:hypothetical protein